MGVLRWSVCGGVEVVWGRWGGVQVCVLDVYVRGTFHLQADIVIKTMIWLSDSHFHQLYFPADDV